MDSWFRERVIARYANSLFHGDFCLIDDHLAEKEKPIMRKKLTEA